MLLLLLSLSLPLSRALVVPAPHRLTVQFARRLFDEMPQDGFGRNAISSLLPSSSAAARRRFLHRSPSLWFSGSAPARIARTRWRRRGAEDEDEDAFALDERGLDLEAEIYEFMRGSPHPSEFPSRRELIEAGRSDLAEAVAAHGGCLAYGWDLGGGEEERSGGGGIGWNGRSEPLGCAGVAQEDGRMFQERILNRTGSYTEEDAVVFYAEEDLSATEASSSGRWLDAEHREDVIGIEGILSRLEKERNLAFGVDLKGKGSRSRELGINAGHGRSNTSLVNHLQTDTIDDGSMTSEYEEIFLQDYGRVKMQNKKVGDFNDNRMPQHDSWRTWTVQGLHFPARDFEAGEIIPTDNKVAFDHDIQNDDSVNSDNCIDYSVQPTERNQMNFDKSHIRVQLQRLEKDLTAALDSLRSRSDFVISHKERSLNELHSLSDDWEFQENEIMKAKDKLRSIRAKMAVIEGKMTLQIIESQKMMEGKQRRLTAAENALRLLRTACIVWPNYASEVQLADSFDGWTTHRRMERSSSGIFSLLLKLYPGRYEVKFIVDGEWRVDPLRPIVQNNGFENNLLVIPP